ncbi:MAG: enoyl-CoA hydratase/isomerase family protein [Candidatus Saccharibacteria bacterium]
MDYKTIIFEKEDHIGIVSLNRPEQKNAINLELMKEVKHCFDRMALDRDIRVVILTGNNEAFSAGFDMPMAIGLQDPQLRAEMVEVCNDLFLKILKFRAPVIAAVSGPALAAGFDLQVMADIRVYSETAKVGQVEINVAVTPLIDPLWKIIGLGRAKEVTMSGRIYGAEEAHNMGLANFVYPVDTYFNEAKKLANHLCRQHQVCMEAIKEQGNRIPGMEVEQAIRTQLWTFRNFVGQPAMIKRMEAFLAKSKLKNNE